MDAIKNIKLPLFHINTDKTQLKEIIVTAFVLLSIDLTYIYSKSDYFKTYFEKIQKSPVKFNSTGAILAYLFLVLGLYYFVIREKKPITYAFLLKYFCLRCI